MRLSFSVRTGLAVGLSTVAVVGLYAWALHHTLQGAVARWERESLAAVAHHAAGMLERVEPGERAATFARLHDDLGGFGVTVRLAHGGAAAATAAVQVPVGKTGEVLAVSAALGTPRLGGRLAPLYLSLALTLSVVLFLVVEVSAYWGLVRPLRGLSRQLRSMRHGPWRVAAPQAGPEELAGLAREVEETGETLERQITSWVEAERRASAELMRRRLEVAASPHLRGIARGLAELLARSDQALPRSDLLALQAQADRLEELFGLPWERIVTGPPGSPLAIPVPGGSR